MPVFCRARTVPYALREKREEEISRLQDQGIIEPLRFSDWAAPVVPVVKSDGRTRLCGDYKVTINRASKIDKYPLPRIDYLLTTLAGANDFPNLIWHTPIYRFHWNWIRRNSQLSTHLKDFTNTPDYRLAYPPHPRSFRE